MQSNFKTENRGLCPNKEASPNKKGEMCQLYKVDRMTHMCAEICLSSAPHFCTQNSKYVLLPTCSVSPKGQDSVLILGDEDIRSRNLKT